MRHFDPERYGTDGVQEAADAELAGHFDLVEAHLHGREWLVGDERTVADFFLFMLTRWGRFIEPQSGSARTSARTGCGRSSCPGRGLSLGAGVPAPRGLAV